MLYKASLIKLLQYHSVLNVISLYLQITPSTETSSIHGIQYW